MGSKCRVCREPAIIDLARHNANFCATHFEEHCRRQVERTIRHHRMLSPEDRILVAVSGGKDSLAVWDILLELGYRADGLLIGLGIGEYSEHSRQVAEAFADARGLNLRVIDLRSEHHFDIPTAAYRTGRVPCSACGLSKRHLFDRAATEGGYDVVVTGHNLDDEAAVLFGNTLRWEIDYLRRQSPVLEARFGMPRKVKPLIRLGERETAAWCIVRGIDYLVEDCPIAVGNRHLSYKAALNTIEEMSPGAKAAFYLNFIEKMAPLLEQHTDAEPVGSCAICGSATTTPVCAFCRLTERVAGSEPVPVDLVLRGPRNRMAGNR